MMPFPVLTSRSALARCAAAEYSLDGRAVASVRSPFTSTLPALGACAGALVIGGSDCIEPLSTGTSVTFALDPPSACAVASARVCAGFACRRVKPQPTDATTPQTVSHIPDAVPAP